MVLKEGLGKVKFKERFGFINVEGRELILPEYDDANDFENGLPRR